MLNILFSRCSAVQHSVPYGRSGPITGLLQGWELERHRCRCRPVGLRGAVPTKAGSIAAQVVNTLLGVDGKGDVYGHGGQLRACQASPASEIHPVQQFSIWGAETSQSLVLTGFFSPEQC